MVELVLQSETSLRRAGGPSPELSDHLVDALDTLKDAFASDFAVIDARHWSVVQRPQGLPQMPWADWSTLCREVALRGTPEFIDESLAVAILAVPIPHTDDLVAVAPFLTERTIGPGQWRMVASDLRADADELAEWAAHATTSNMDSLVRVARLAINQINCSHQIRRLERDLQDASSHLLSTYEEISLLHRLTENLSLSSTDVELAEQAIDWLIRVLPAEAVALRFEPAETRQDDAETRLDEVGVSSPQVLGQSRSDLTIDSQLMEEIVSELGYPANGATAVNQLQESLPHWCRDDVRDVAMVPVPSGAAAPGWLIALNHTGDNRLGSRDFGSVETRLLGSVATLLGIHSHNVRLYREQTRFFEEVVLALTSAIDAKDPYTCGHSDRVARISVCLARRLGMPTDELNTLYLSGLLHDIGKIGIADSVLRKAGPLTDEEFDHIKTHPQLGYQILKGIKRLDKVLPVVLHHHEAWNGRGYPLGLAGEAIPYSARICAVADGFDAMGSDRPYRKGMPEEKVDEILRTGAGKQWDAKVVEAFFAVRDEIREISQKERASLSLNVEQWQH